MPLAVYGGSIPAGDVVRKVATAMSAAALYIYIGQTFVIKAFTIPFKGEIPVLLQPLAFVACVLFGIVVSRAVAKIPALWEMRHRQLSTGRIAGGLS